MAVMFKFIQIINIGSSKLQRVMLKLVKYQLRVNYMPCKELYVADTERIFRNSLCSKKNHNFVHGHNFIMYTDHKQIVCIMYTNNRNIGSSRLQK